MEIPYFYFTSALLIDNLIFWKLVSNSPPFKLKFGTLQIAICAMEGLYKDKYWICKIIGMSELCKLWCKNWHHLGVGRVESRCDGNLIFSSWSDMKGSLPHYRHVQMMDDCHLHHCLSQLGKGSFKYHLILNGLVHKLGLPINCYP